MPASRFLIAGKVQGVWFRANTREEALRLNLRGYASNLPDGRVEVLAIGEAEAIKQLSIWLQQGPLLARVETIEHHDAGSSIDANPGFTGFQIR